jgi:hypothetical protein
LALAALPQRTPIEMTQARMGKSRRMGAMARDRRMNRRARTTAPSHFWLAWLLAVRLR